MTHAESVLHEMHTFTNQWPVGLGNSVYVVGNVPELGDWNPIDAVKLRYTTNDIWRGQIHLPRDTTVEYKFISRDDGRATHCNFSNVVWEAGSNRVLQTGSMPEAPYQGKTIYYLSSWSNAFLLEVLSTGGVLHAMTPVGPGRLPAETLYRVRGVGAEGQPLEFVLTDGSGNFDNAPHTGFGNPGAPNYYTSLDIVWLQDGNLYNYEPAASPSAPQVVPGFVQSTATNIPARNIRVYLPRGYLEHTNRFYPVLYMHDGQNVFTPGGAFGSWDADLTATKEISQGRMRECIIVGINNNANRLQEYLPPGDEITPGQPAWGSNYVDFVEDNVRPYINGLYRTLTDRAHTYCMGSSMGGLISLYMGVERTGWGRIGVMSPAFWRGVNYYASLQNKGTEGIDQIYLDWGTSESFEAWSEWYGIYNVFLKDGYSLHGNWRSVIGCGDAHNEAAWARRLPEAFRFMLNILEDKNLLGLREFDETRMSIQSVFGGDFEVEYPTRTGLKHTLWSGEAPDALTTKRAEVIETHYPWNIRRYTETSAVPRRIYGLEMGE